MKKAYYVVSIVLLHLLFVCGQEFCVSCSVHWTPDANNPGVAHGATVSGNIWINSIEPTDNDSLLDYSPSRLL